MSKIVRWALILVVILVGVLAYLGWKVAVFCYSLDYPENFELVVSRCRDAEILDVSPNGEYIVVQVNYPETEYWLINNLTDEVTTLLSTVGSRNPYLFVTDDVLLSLGEQIFLWEISSQKSYKLEVLNLTRDQLGWVEILATVEDIYYLEPSNFGVAFGTNQESGEGRRYFLIDTQEYRGQRYEIKEMLLEEAIDFKVVLSSSHVCATYPPSEGCLSHNGEFLANGTGVSTIAGDFVMSQSTSDLPIRRQTPKKFWAGWTHDDSGLFLISAMVIYPLYRAEIYFFSRGNIPGGVGILKLPEQ